MFQWNLFQKIFKEATLTGNGLRPVSSQNTKFIIILDITIDLMLGWIDASMLHLLSNFNEKIPGCWVWTQLNPFNKQKSNKFVKPL